MSVSYYFVAVFLFVMLYFLFIVFAFVVYPYICRPLYDENSKNKITFPTTYVFNFSESCFKVYLGLSSVKTLINRSILLKNYLLYT